MMRTVLVVGLGLEVLDLDESRGGLIEHIFSGSVFSYYMLFHCFAQL